MIIVALKNKVFIFFYMKKGKINEGLTLSFLKLKFFSQEALEFAKITLEQKFVEICIHTPAKIVKVNDPVTNLKLTKLNSK